MSMFLLGLSNTTYSSKVMLMLFVVNPHDRFSGVDNTTTGGMVSFGPPDGETTLAQLLNVNAIAQKYMIRFKIFAISSNIEMQRYKEKA